MFLAYGIHVKLLDSRYDIFIEAEGEYSLAIRNYHNNPDHTESNDCWAKIDDLPFAKVFSSVVDTWNKATSVDLGGGCPNCAPLSAFLAQGSHRITLSGRSNGFRIDSIMLEAKSCTVPTTTPTLTREKQDMLVQTAQPNFSPQPHTFTSTLVTSSSLSTSSSTTSTSTSDMTHVPRWLKYPDLLEPASELASILFKNSLYVFASKVGHPYRFDLESQRWDAAGIRPRPFPGGHHAVLKFNQKIYVLGGFGQSSWGKMQIFKPLNPIMSQWSIGPKIPYGDVGSVAAVRIGDMFYVCGGLSPNLGTQRDCAKFSPYRNRWHGVADMPFGVNHAAAGTNGDLMYVFGGRTKATNSVSDGIKQMQVYNPAKDEWTLGVDMPFKNAGMGHAAFLDGRFFIFGGETKTQQNLATENNVFAHARSFDPVTNTWEKLPPMPHAAHGIYPVADEDRRCIYVAGGDLAAGMVKTEGAIHFQVYKLAAEPTPEGRLAGPDTSDTNTAAQSKPGAPATPIATMHPATPIATTAVRVPASDVVATVQVNIICFPCKGAAKITKETVWCSDAAMIKQLCTGVCGHPAMIAQCI